MINGYAYDVEVLPNFFSITIISINDYLKKFEDIVDEEGNAVPLIDKLSIAEIKDRLSKVEEKSFYISDTDDSQFLSMIAYINNLKSNGKDFNHLFGYNSMNYDKLIVAYLLMNYNNYSTVKELLRKIYETSKHIINTQREDFYSKNDYLLTNCRNYALPYKDIDIMKIFALNKVGSYVDKDGNTKYTGKSLKQTSINIRWYELLEYSLPPISDVDKHYYEKDYPGRPVEELNKIIEPFDRYILSEWIPDTMHYNKNDVYIVCEMFRLFKSEVKLRYSLSRSYKIDFLNSSRSNIADKLFAKYYNEFSGLDEKYWKGLKTERTIMSFKRVIFDNIKFKTKPLQDFLERIKKVKVTRTSKDSFLEEITIGKLVYTMAAGGIHSKDIPRELISNIDDLSSLPTGKTNFCYVHFDISSFYPSLMAVYKIAPEHLNKDIFAKLVAYFRDTRVTAKHTKGLIDGINASDLAQALKIVINSIYGKFGFEKGDLYDRLATLKVTINGQLFILMLCEELELNGIEVMSANTDGIVVKLYGDKVDDFKSITNNWLNYTGLQADSEYYKKYINRDINNYIIVELNGKTSYKGALDPNQFLNDLSKGYDMPIVAKAISNYFLHDIPVMETFYSSKNILDFCKTQNVSRSFGLYFNNSNIQRNSRFYVSNNGGRIHKIDKVDGRDIDLCSGYNTTVLNSLDDTPIYNRDINYKYYYEECYKIINPIKLRISPNQKGDANNKTKSGKALLKKYAGCYNTLFDE